MKNSFQKMIFAFVLVLLPFALFAQQKDAAPKKYALVIGNGSYKDLSRLTNPINDANDVAIALQGLGFSVEKLLNGSLDQMESSITRLKNRLSVQRDAYGFIFYAGHGVQSGGENYLIPTDVTIPAETYLRARAVCVQTVLDDLREAGNILNVVVLDACRDNPFGWARSGSRGLTIVTRQPADSIVVYATSAGSKASDGTGRNGLFTTQFLKNLKDQSLEVTELFRRTGSEVAQVSNREQVPAIYNQFFGTAYLGTKPVAQVPAAAAPAVKTVFEAGAVNTAMGSLEILTTTAGIVEIIGENIKQKIALPDYGSLPIAKINSGQYTVLITYENGKTESKTVEIGRSEAKKVEFTYKMPAWRPDKPAVAQKPQPDTKPGKTPKDKNPQQPKDPKTVAAVNKKARLNTLGASVGSTFAAPLVIGTVHGTFAPWNNTFVELGLDLGFASAAPTAENYFSVYPFAHMAYFMPFKEKGGWYAGGGIGYINGKHTFPGKVHPINTVTADVTTGFNIANMLDLSVTLRTDFVTGVNYKVAAGYVYRFK